MSEFALFDYLPLTNNRLQSQLSSQLLFDELLLRFTHASRRRSAHPYFLILQQAFLLILIVLPLLLLLILLLRPLLLPALLLLHILSIRIFLLLK